MSKVMAQRQRIGPQIRHLRQLRGLTLDDLAGSAGLSASHLSRLERSQTLPSFTVLANIAQVLDVSIDEFVQLEHDLQELDEQLALQSDLLALDDNAYQEILGLSIDTRRQLNHAIELLSNGNLSDVRIQEQISQVFEDKQTFKDAYPELKQMVATSGQNAVGLARSHVQLTEIPGPRIGILTNPGLLATAPNIDYTMIYRGLFPKLPLDPSVARKWTQWYSLAADDFPFDWPIKLIVHEDLLSRVSDRFKNSPSIDGDVVAARVSRYWKQMLSNGGHFEMAVTSDDTGPINVLTAGKAAALFEYHESYDSSEDTPTGLWVSSSHLVDPVLTCLERTWDKLPKKDKDPQVVSEWLDRHTS